MEGKDGEGVWKGRMVMVQLGNARIVTVQLGKARMVRTEDAAGEGKDG